MQKLGTGPDVTISERLTLGAALNSLFPGCEAVMTVVPGPTR